MKILLTNNSLCRIAGSETWTMAMYDELSKEHEVDILTGRNTMLKIGEYDADKEYDIAICNHNNRLNDIAGNINIKTKIFTSHGVLPRLEQPVQGADHYVSVSEEVQGNLKSRGFDSTVIRNPIDLDRFKSTKPINKELKKILFLNKRNNGVIDIVKEACKDYELTIISESNRVSNIEELINENDLVITLGRGAYEAMGCERNVIVFDYIAADGFVTPETILEYRKNNCSGRRYLKKWGAEDLKTELKKYDPDLGTHLREYVLENNNIKKNVELYLQLHKNDNMENVVNNDELLVCNGFTDGNYGAWLNNIMENSPSEWVVFYDHDTFLVNPNWYHMIKEHIKNAPEDCGLLTCVTNRIGNPQQRVKCKIDNNDIEHHRNIAQEIAGRDIKLVEATRSISGIMMVTSKTAWKKAGGFRETGGYIGLDNNYHGRIKLAGYKAYIMNDLYLYHWYRFGTGKPQGRAPVVVNKPEPVKEIEKKEYDGAVFCSYRIDGGGNQSGKKLAEMLGYQFVNLHTTEWKGVSAKKQIWYMNDNVYALNGKDKEEFEKVLATADDIKVCLNFVIGGTHKEDWVMKYPVSKMIFLNGQRKAEWDAAVEGTPRSMIDSIAICPPINLELFENVNREDSDKIRIGRHSRISLKFPEDPCDLYKKLDRDDREFHFMLAHPKIKKEFTGDNFKYYEWNEKPVEKFLEDIDIWLCIINPKTKEQGPRTLAEAMASGCCCIAENRDGPTDKIIHGETGFLVNNEKEAVELIGSLTKERIKEIGKNARDYALKNFSPGNWIGELK